MEVYFIRHGATKGNTEHRYVGRTDEEILLSAREELRKTGETLGLMNHVFVSPYVRCIQSAEALFEKSQEFQKQMEVIKDFREMDFGAFEYKNYQELNGNPDYQRYIDSGGTIAFPQGEEPKAFKERCIRAYVQCMEKAKKQGWNKVAFVVHGGTIMAILEKYGLPKAGYFDYQVKNGGGFAGEVTEENHVKYWKIQIDKNV